MLKFSSRSSRNRVSVGTGVLIAGLLAGEATAQYENYLLPDMMPWISGNLRYGHGWIIDGDEIRLATAPLNAGVGHLEIFDDPNDQGQSDIDVYQRLYEIGGTYNDYMDVQVGNFINHPDHGHFHFEGYAIQQLREVTAGNGIGDVVAAGEKISFCMINIDQFDSDLYNNSTTGSNGQPLYYSGCSRGHTGISAGYADVYSSGLSGQFIDITGLSTDAQGNFNGGLNGTGVYWMEVTIDPDNAMIESNNHNNSAYMLVDLNDTTGSVGSGYERGRQLDDHADTSADATWLNDGEWRYGEINWEADEDRYSADVVEGALYMLRYEETQILYSDVTILDTTGTNEVFYANLGSSDRTNIDTTFRANGTGDYYVEIGETRSDFGNSDGAYHLRWDLVAIAGDVDQDGVVDVTDLDLILATWGDSVAAGTAGDFDADGTIGAGDLSILTANWGSTLADYGVAAVPEPGSIALLAMGGLALLRRRR